MAVLNKRTVVLNDMEHGNNIYLEQSLVNIDKKHLSSVKITDYPDSGHANPEPLSDYQEDALEDFLSPQFLKHITGKKTLAEVTYLEMEVDTSETSIGNLGQLLPNLRQLKLSNSVILSVRDLGTCLNDLTTLWLQRCGLIDLDGISCFNSIKELYLAYNEIDDLSSLSMLDNLSYLDLEGNNIDDIAQVEFLALCTRLVSLSLSGNPVETAPHPDTSEKDLKFYDYRSAISKAVPQLRVLDDEPFLFDIIDGKQVIRSTSSTKQQNNLILKEDILMVQESLKALPVIEEDEQDEQESHFVESGNQKRPGSGLRQEKSRPVSGRNRPMSGRNRPLSSRSRPTSSLTQRNRSITAPDRPATSHAPDSPLKRPESVRSGRANAVESQNSLDEDDSSDLTHGSKQVLCGNPVRALLARRKELKGDIKLKFDRNSPEVSSNQFIPEHSYHLDDDDEDIDRNAVFEELKKWRENFEKTSRDLVASQPTTADSTLKETRASLSPTPPSGNPSRLRPSRRKIQTPPEIPRPQTASDFRPSVATRDPGERTKKTHIISKSMEMKGQNEIGKEIAKQVDQRISPKIATGAENATVSKNSTPNKQMEMQGRAQYYRPGTAAAAYKKRSQKHFS